MEYEPISLFKSTTLLQAFVVINFYFRVPEYVFMFEALPLADGNTANFRTLFTNFELLTN